MSILIAPLTSHDEKHICFSTTTYASAVKLQNHHLRFHSFIRESLQKYKKTIEIQKKQNKMCLFTTSLVFYLHVYIQQLLNILLIIPHKVVSLHQN